MFFWFKLNGDPRDLHVRTPSFPPRRSSDLWSFRHLRLPSAACIQYRMDLLRAKFIGVPAQHPPQGAPSYRSGPVCRQAGEYLGQFASRSEEHTSELQSLMRISYAVFCLKKKNKHTPTTNLNKSHYQP